MLNEKCSKRGFSMAVNLRMVSDFECVAALPIRHFDGLDRFEELPRDHRHVADMWF